MFYQIFFIIFLLGGCSHIGIKTDSNDFSKLTKALHIVENYYVEKIELSTLMTYALNNKFNDFNRINNKTELYKNFMLCITSMQKINNYTHNEIFVIVLKNLMNHLDKYSTYLDKSSIKTIKMKQFTYSLLDKKLLYIKVSTFTHQTADNIRNAIKAHTDKSIILDLRNNFGGSFNAAIETVDLFVDRGIIVRKRGQDLKNTTTYTATSQNFLSTAPLVILVNKNSASSSEIVSGALQNLHRATIIGTKTFGKGTIQALIPIDKKNNEYIKLTTARYYLANRKSIDEKIIPDIEALENKNQLLIAIDFLTSQT